MSASTASQSTSPSTWMLTHSFRPYGEAKYSLRPRNRVARRVEILNAIVGRPLIISNATNIFLPARNVGWPHAVFSVTSGHVRQSFRARAKIGRSKGLATPVNATLPATPGRIVYARSLYGRSRCSRRARRHWRYQGPERPRARLDAPQHRNAPALSGAPAPGHPESSGQRTPRHRLREVGAREGRHPGPDLRARSQTAEPGRTPQGQRKKTAASLYGPQR